MVHTTCTHNLAQYCTQHILRRLFNRLHLRQCRNCCHYQEFNHCSSRLPSDVITKFNRCPDWLKLGGTYHISLYHDKPAPFQNTHKPAGFKFLYDARSLTIEPEDPKTIPEFLERHSTKDRIRKELQASAKSVKELAELLGKKESNIRVVLSSMKNEIVNEGGVYALTNTQVPGPFL